MAGTVVKGAVSIEIDAREIEAKLRFAPSKDGEDWNAERVLQLAGQLRLVPAPTPRVVDELLQKLGKSKEPVSAVLIRGTPPEEPVGEQVAWSDLPIPEDLKPAVEERLRTAKAPVLYRVRVEKIKRETVVKKPNALPFLPPKEEVVVTYDKKETKEAAAVDPALLDSAYAEAGQKIGTLIAPKPGKPGKGVYGKTIPAMVLPDPAFLTGDGIVRDKSELRAAVSGVLRIGANWADLVPLTKPKWSVDRSPDGTSFLLRFEPGDPIFPVPNGADVLAAAVSSGAVEADLCPEQEISEAIARATRLGEALSGFSLSRKKDGEVRVDISADQLKATLTLRKGTGGGAPLELKAIAEAIKASGVRGYAADKVKADILAFYKGTDISLVDYVLVEGRAATRGQDREIKPAVSFLSDQERAQLAGRIAADTRRDSCDGCFPPTEATHVAFADTDGLLAVVTQPPPGVAGVDVFGNTLPGLPGNDPDLRPLGGIRMKGSELRAETAGLLLAKLAEKVLHAYIVPYRDSKIEVEIAADAMSASLSLIKEEGSGIPLSADAVNKALADAGVVRGLDGTAIADTLLEALEKGRAGPAIVARGETPVAGGEQTIRWLVQQPSGKGVTIRADGRADFKNQDRFVSVAEGTAVLEIVKEGAEGRPGFDVKGKVLESGQAKSVEIQHDDSLREEPIDGGVRLVAVRTGEVSFDGTTVKINALHGIKGDVGPATGNINFPGEVRVSGGVKAGFAIIGGQDVLIAEGAEAALVSAGGKAVIGQGIIGGGKGIVRARLGIEAGFAEHATLLAVEDVKVKNGCLGCQVKTNGKLRLVGEKGHLIGGICRARHGTESVNLGSERGTKTEISFGQDYLIKDQIEVIERETDKARNAMADLDKRIGAIQHTGAALDAARAEKVKLMKQIEKLGLKLFTLREKFEEHHESEVRVRGTVFPGVILESHGRYLEIKQKKSQVVFYFDREVGRIQDKSLK